MAQGISASQSTRPVDATAGELRSGRVLVVSPEVGTGYIVEDQTNRRFGFSRRFVGVASFNRLTTGARVQFQDNGHNAVAMVLDDR